ncbi:uncharacterized protein LOC111110896 [Crassostrea virginica]
MDPRYCAQDVVRCALCRDAVAPMYCNVCHTHLCGHCVEKHFSDKSKFHNVVPLEQLLSTDFENKMDVLRRDLNELEKTIFPKYQESAVIIKTQKTNQRKHSQKLTAELNKEGEALHKEINTIIQKKLSEIEEMDKQHTAAIEKQEDVIYKAHNEIKQVIRDIKILLNTSDVGLVSKYRSRIAEFRKLPPKLKISLPNILHQKIDREELLKQFGSLSPLSIETEEQGYTVPSPRVEFSPPDRPLLNVPRLITELNTGYDVIYSISCLSDEEIWTSGNNYIMKLYNLNGEVLTSIQTESGLWPDDTAVTRSGDLVYSDRWDSSIYLVSGTQIKTLITQWDWRPLGLCSTSCEDLLVIMESDDGEESKVVRYSGSTEKQSIQWDNQGKPLYSSGYGYKYLSENRNLDICVVDGNASEVVVVSAAGKLRFRYTGPPSTPRESFNPYGITTDSQANILTSDTDSQRIHIIDQDGHFLLFIHNRGLQDPHCLCVDSRDNLFVADFAGKVYKVQYYK